MPPKPWHRADIVAAIWKTGTSLRTLSMEAGYAPSTLRAALERPHPQAHDIIAAHLGVTRQTIWPQFYGPDGTRRRLSLPFTRGIRARAA